MEHLTAALFAVLYYLFCQHLGRERRKTPDPRVGPLLRRFVRPPSLAAALATFALTALVIWLFWDSSIGSFTTFLLVFFALRYNPSTWWQVVEFDEWGIVQLNMSQRHFTPWASIEYCKWMKVPGALHVVLREREVDRRLRLWQTKVPDAARVVLRQPVLKLPKGSIPCREVEEATAIFSRHVQVADAQGHVLNPEFKAAEQPAGPKLDRSEPRRFQFDLRTLLFFMLVASAAMSWYGIGYRRDREEQAILAQLERFKPKIARFARDLWLDFSASPVKPGDQDLEVVAKLSRLEDLDLTGAPVTDAGLIHLENLSSLRHVRLFQTRVTDAGVKRLQRALPKAAIVH